MKNNDVKEIVFYHCGNAEITCKFDNVIDGYRIVSIQGTTGVLVIPSAINIFSLFFMENLHNRAT